MGVSKQRDHLIVEENIYVPNHVLHQKLSDSGRITWIGDGSGPQSFNVVSIHSEHTYGQG